ncbi:MAG TPA: bifunctional YncE family protein/alkaline phosphatase family protein [Mycobacteriales bacterium]|jgi:YVTN family beta-propeller protein|nr:bifunctional YncE family protein/alkaline phosphatase family protein [Mycobacteriales bacterium]
MRRTGVALAVVAATAVVAGALPGDRRVGRQGDGSVVTPTGQMVRPAGLAVEVAGRPNAVALHPRGHTAALLTALGAPVTVVDLTSRRVLQRTGSGKASFAGLAYAPDGRALYASLADGAVLRFAVGADGRLSHAARLALPSAGRHAEIAGGLAVSPDGRRLHVALNRSNALAVLDAATGRLLRRYPVGVAPHDVLLAGGTAVVSEQGGAAPRPGERTNGSAGTPVASTAGNGAAAAGTVSLVDLRTGRVARVRVGLHPAGLALRGRHVYVANAAGDSVSVVDLAARRVVATLPVAPFAGAAGVSPNAVAPLGREGLVVSLGRANAVAVYRWPDPARPATLLGLLPTGWYPDAVAVDAPRRRLVVAHAKGLAAPPASFGALAGHPDAADVRGERGGLTLVAFPSAAALRDGTRAVAELNGWAAAAAARLAPRRGVAPVPVPARVGEPSTIKHVFYVVKENRTYDQVLGDDPRGDGDPRYLQFGESVTPNQHLLAKRFPLLDNVYVSGTVSADGHQWAMQANVTDYVERQFGSFARGYSYDGGDALAYAPTGFLWENALRHHRSVRVYGEFADHRDRTGTRSDVPSLDRVLARHYPPFTLEVSDAERMRVLLGDLAAQVPKHGVADLTIVQLPLDHTHGLVPGRPTPQSDVADNDAALGRLVDWLSHSPIWHETAVFVVEDDAQDGLDHVDGHRTTMFVASPYARAGLVDHTFYTQVDVVRTVEQILGLPPMTVMDLVARPMTTVFATAPDVTPFVAVPRLLPETTNPEPAALTGAARAWAEASEEWDLDHPDAAPEQQLNRAIWYAVRGFVPYPGDGRVLLPSDLGAEAEDDD